MEQPQSCPVCQLIMTSVKDITRGGHLGCLSAEEAWSDCQENEGDEE